MARWKLTEPHYLSVPNERWEHNTVDSRTGKPIRKMYKVPKHLDPRVEDDWTHKVNGMDGEIYVCHAPATDERDIIFEGDPTPGMLPIDDEAKQISAQFTWTPTQGIDEDSQRQSFYAKLGDTLIDQMQQVKAAREMSGSNPNLDKFMETMLAMMAQNQQILAALAGKLPVEVHPDQAVDIEPPLEDAEPTEAEIAEATAAAAQKEAASQIKAINRMHGRRI